MAGTITHEWQGTTLVITSDSGTSACDLKGSQGDMGIRGPQGAAGKIGQDGTVTFDELTDEQRASLKGEKGDTATIALGSCTTGEPGTEVVITNSGTPNAAVFNFVIPKGNVGPQGPKGEPGKGLTILGTYPTLQALTEAVTSAQQGDTYNVGTSAPYDIYMWDSTAASFVSQGKLQGANGAVFTPSVAADGTLSWTNDGGLDNPDAVNIRGPQGEQGQEGPQGQQGVQGEQGPAGYSPVKGQDYFTATDKNEIVSSVKTSLLTYNVASTLPASGTALAADTIYQVSDALTTYAFTPPASGWAHGYFSTGATASITFSGNIVGAAPEIVANSAYEFDVYDGIWIVQGVVSV